MSETIAYATLARQAERLERENDNLLNLLHDHQNHWNNIGWAFGLCMGGVDGDDVTDLHGNAALIIEHCLNVAERSKKETATECCQLVADKLYGGCIIGAAAVIKEKFGLEI